MGAKGVKIEGNGRRMTEEELKKLKDANALSRKQTKKDSKVDSNLLKTDFNF